ncbi:retrograde regulation protein 2 [Aureobasidium pullulans]|nr:retrograde regulation protein 2 [Aureobasidium pullulans]
MADSKAGISVAFRQRELDGRREAQTRRWWQFGGNDVAFVSVDSGIESETSSIDTSNTPKIETNVFQAAEVSDIYKPIEGFEGAHRFDPNASWTSEEEKALVRRLDWRIALPACIMFFAIQLDRGNIVQALSDDMLKDLKLTKNDYNNGMTVFYCSFLLAELPSQLISKKLGPDNWIPIQMISWSILAASQAALSGKTSFYITRMLLGLIEGGFIPDTILYLSYFYKNSELPKRLSWFWTSYQSTQIVGAFLAYGILHLRSHTGLIQGWRYLFAVEGSFTGLIGFLLSLLARFADSNCSRRVQGSSQTQREEVVMVTRILRDDPGKATMHNRQGLSLNLFWEALTDYDMWPLYIVGVSWTIPASPPAAYITLTCKALGFDTFETNLLAIPAYALFIIQLLFWTWFSEKANQHLLLGVLNQIWCLPLLIALITLPTRFNNSNWVKWLLSTLLIGYPYIHAILVGLTSRNFGSVRTRTVGSSLYNMSVQLASVVSSQNYRADDAPYYYKGNKVLVAIVAWNIIAFVGAKVYYVRKNAYREKIWGAISREERIEYLSTTEDKDNKRLEFRFAH